MSLSHSTRVNDRLRQERIRRNWRQRDLAEQLGTTVLTVKRWERGYQQPNFYFRLKLCALFGKSEEELGLVSAAAPEETVVWAVPFPRNPFFTGRELILEHLHAALIGTPTSTRELHSYALQGLGGIGKTQLALEYAYRHQSAYQAVLWVEAETYASLISSFVRLAGVLALPEEAEEDLRRIVAAVLRWFNRRKGWLLIFDNVEDLTLVKPFLPLSDQGALLLTTRLQTLGTLAQTISLSLMTMQEGVDFLLRRTKRLFVESTRQPDDVQEKVAIRAIVAEMGGLPLALEQVGAYINATHCRLSDYLPLYRTAQYRLLDEHEGSSDHPLSVNQTFVLAFDRVAKRNPLAAALLTVCAFLAPDDIPETAFLEGASLLGSTFEVITTDPLVFPEAIKVLLSYALIQRHPETQSFSLHRLVQVVLRQRLPEPEQERWRGHVLRLLSAAFPKANHKSWEQRERLKTWKQCERLLSHVLACVTLIPEHYKDLELSHLLQKVGIYLSERGQQYAQAEALCERALHIHMQILGPEHPEIAAFLYEQGGIYTRLGKYEEAEAFYQQALHVYEQRLELERPEMARVFGALAYLFWIWGKYQEAERQQKQALGIWQQALEPEHREIVLALSRLALFYQSQGKYEEAIPIHEQVLSIYERSMGPKDFNEAMTLNNLAALYQEQGKYDEAELFYRRALHLNVQVGGPEHPRVAEVLYNLADFFSLQKKHKKAQPLYEWALRLWKQTLGPDHPRVAFALNGLANLFRDQGKYRQARLLYQRALMILQQYLGPQHPAVAETLHELAHFHHLQQETTEALALYQQALAIREHVYGSQHPKTEATRSGLTTLLQEMSLSSPTQTYGILKEKGGEAQFCSEGEDDFTG